MKNILFLSLITALMVVFVGCEQEEFDLQSENSYDATTQRILDFGSSLTKKSGNGDNMHIDSLVWYSEAWFNLNYGHPHLDYENVTTDSMKITIDLREGSMVTPDIVANTHIEMNNFIVKQYDNFLDDPKHMIVMDVNLRSQTSSKAELWLYSTIGKSINENGDQKSVSNPFEYYDWWHAYYFEGGRCNGYQSQFPSDENAADQLEKYFKDHNSDFAYLNSPRVYFTDVITGEDIYWELVYNDDPNTQDLYPTLVYGPDYERTCLSPDDMYFFLSKMDDVLIHNRPDSYTDKHPFNIVIEARTATGKEKSGGEHVYLYDLGVKHFSPRPVHDPALMR